MFFRGLIALKGCTVDAGMPGSVIGADKLLKKIIEFLGGVDLFHIEAIEPGFFAGSPKSFNLGLGEDSQLQLYQTIVVHLKSTIHSLL